MNTIRSKYECNWKKIVMPECVSHAVPSSRPEPCSGVIIIYMYPGSILWLFLFRDDFSGKRYVRPSLFEKTRKISLQGVPTIVVFQYMVLIQTLDSLFVCEFINLYSYVVQVRERGLAKSDADRRTVRTRNLCTTKIKDIFMMRPFFAYRHKSLFIPGRVQDAII